MDIYFYGQSCFKLKGKNASVLIDPYSPEFTGLKLPKDLSAHIAISTHNHDDHNNLDAVTDSSLRISGPGEYEVAGISVTGVATFHDKEIGSPRGGKTVLKIFF